MTAQSKIDRTRLAAFVDGELSPEEAAAVVMHLADHPADQAYVDDLFAANAALALLQREALPQRVAGMAPYFEDALHQLQGAPHVTDIRNFGFAGAVQLQAYPNEPAKSSALCPTVPKVLSAAPLLV